MALRFAYGGIWLLGRTSESSSSLCCARGCCVPPKKRICSRKPANVSTYMELWKAPATAWVTNNKIDGLATALRCSSLCRIATSCQDLASKDGLDSKINQLLSTKAQRVPKKSKIGNFCHHTGLWYVDSALLWRFDTIRIDLSGYGVYTKTVGISFPLSSSIPLFLSSSYVFKSLRTLIVLHVV